MSSVVDVFVGQFAGDSYINMTANRPSRNTPSVCKESPRSNREFNEEIIQARVEMYAQRVLNGEDIWTGQPLTFEINCKK